MDSEDLVNVRYKSEKGGERREGQRSNREAEDIEE